MFVGRCLSSGAFFDFRTLFVPQRFLPLASGARFAVFFLLMLFVLAMTRRPARQRERA